MKTLQIFLICAILPLTTSCSHYAKLMINDTKDSNVNTLDIKSNPFPFALGVVVIAELKFYLNIGGKAIDTITITDSTGNIIWKTNAKKKVKGGAMTIRYGNKNYNYDQIIPSNNEKSTSLIKGNIYGIEINFKDKSNIKERFINQPSTVYLKIIEPKNN